MFRSTCRSLYSTIANAPAVPRFWKTVSIVTEHNGFKIHLDNRTLKAPEGSTIIIPKEMRTIAMLVAGEWEGQDKLIKSSSLPMTSLIVRGTQSIIPVRKEVEENLIRYLNTDSICYFHDELEEIYESAQKLQQELWDPIINWANSTFNIQVKKSTSIIPITQDAATITTMKQHLQSMSDIQLAAFERAVMSSKSFLIPLALTKKAITVEFAVRAARAEVLQQIQKWGEVEDAHDIDNERMMIDLASAAILF